MSSTIEILPPATGAIEEVPAPWLLGDARTVPS